MAALIPDRDTNTEPYPDAPDFYFGVTVPEYLKVDWARSPGHAFRMGVLNTISLMAQYHDISKLQDDWGHMCKEDATRRTAWLRGEW